MTKEQIQELREKHNLVKITRHDKKTMYIECINYHPLDYPIEKLLKEVEFGEIIYESNRIVTTKKIKNF